MILISIFLRFHCVTCIVFSILVYKPNSRLSISDILKFFYNDVFIILFVIFVLEILILICWLRDTLDFQTSKFVGTFFFILLFCRRLDVHIWMEIEKIMEFRVLFSDVCEYDIFSRNARKYHTKFMISGRKAIIRGHCYNENDFTYKLRKDRRDKICRWKPGRGRLKHM